MSNDSTTKVLAVAAGLCVVCSVLVSTAAVSLRPAQEANKVLDRKSNILVAAGIVEDGAEVDVDSVFEEKIEAKLVDLTTGEYVEGDPDTFDDREAAKDPSTSIELTRNQDLGGIKRRTNVAPIYLIKDGGETTGVILPIHGKGLWSTLYGFLALGDDLETIRGLGFYEHGETPGLGGEVDNPKWKSSWVGKKAFDNEGDVAIEVIKGSVNPSSESSKYQIDGLSGATITARGVSNTVQFWLGDDGFGKYLERLKTDGLG